MVDLFKEVMHPYNLINSLMYTETITYLGPKSQAVVPDEMKESASLEIFFQKSNL